MAVSASARWGLCGPLLSALQSLYASFSLSFFSFLLFGGRQLKAWTLRPPGLQTPLPPPHMPSLTMLFLWIFTSIPTFSICSLLTDFHLKPQAWIFNFHMTCCLTGSSNSPQAPSPSLLFSFSPSQYLKPPSAQILERKPSPPNPSELYTLNEWSV